MTAVDATTGEVLVACTVDEARDLTERMRSHRDNLWRLAIESHDRRAWAAMGYSSWRDYIEAEVGVKSSQAYRLLDHGRTMLALAPGDSLDSPMGESPLPTSERQTRPLSRLPEDERAEAWNEAVEQAESEDRSPTAADVEQAVERRQPKTTVTERESFSRKTETEPPASTDPGPAETPAEPVDVERHADPRLTFRANFSRDIAKAGVLRMVDVDKAVACADADDLAGFRQSVESIRDWCDRFLTASSTSHLRRVK